MYMLLIVLQMLASACALEVGDNDAQGQPSARTTDTVWVETQYQLQMRLDYEDKQHSLELAALYLRRALSMLNSAKLSDRSKATLATIMDEPRHEIVLTRRDRDRYAAQVRHQLDSLRQIYDQNDSVLALLRANLKRGPFYIQTGTFNDVLFRLPVHTVDSLRVLRVCSANGEYYRWQDWVMMHLQPRREDGSVRE